MIFGFRCPTGHEFEGTFRIGECPETTPCPDHAAAGRRVFSPPVFVEDRRHMRRGTPNAPTEDWSWTLGGPRPKSRQEARILEKTMGIEFVSPAEARADAAKLRAGESLDKPQPREKGWLAREVAKRGIRFDRSITGPRPLTREESERKLKAERPEWSDPQAPEAIDLGATKNVG